MEHGIGLPDDKLRTAGEKLMKDDFSLPLRTRLGLEIERQIRHNKAKLHPLHQLFWECTLRCNLHCLHCGSDCKQDSVVPDMPAEDFLHVIDSISPHVDTHQLMINITGGEPLVRKDIEYVGRELYRREYPWGIVSNGMLLTEERLKSLMESGMRSITISLDGFEEEHNWMRGHKMSFQNALRAIRLLAKTENLVWDIVTCVNQRNFPHLHEFRDMICEAGVKDWRLFTIFPVGRAAQHPELQLSDVDFRGLMDFIVETRKEGRIHAEYACEGFLGEYEAKVRDRLYICQAGITTASILIDGSISSCLSVRYNHKQGNIYEDDFMDVWNNRFQVFRNRDWARRGECKDCKAFRYCEGNGMHLHDDDGNLLLCHLKRLRKNS